MRLREDARDELATIVQRGGRELSGLLGYLD
jgi:hypothetical protein